MVLSNTFWCESARHMVGKVTTGVGQWAELPVMWYWNGATERVRSITSYNWFLYELAVTSLSPWCENAINSLMLKNTSGWYAKFLNSRLFSINKRIHILSTFGKFFLCSYKTIFKLVSLEHRVENISFHMFNCICKICLHHQESNVYRYN